MLSRHHEKYMRTTHHPKRIPKGKEKVDATKAKHCNASICCTDVYYEMFLIFLVRKS